MLSNTWKIIRAASASRDFVPTLLLKAANLIIHNSKLKSETHSYDRTQLLLFSSTGQFFHNYSWLCRVSQRWTFTNKQSSFVGVALGSGSAWSRDWNEGNLVAIRILIKDEYQPTTILYLHTKLQCTSRNMHPPSHPPNQLNLTSQSHSHDKELPERLCHQINSIKAMKDTQQKSCNTMAKLTRKSDVWDHPERRCTATVGHRVAPSSVHTWTCHNHHTKQIN